MWGEDRTVKVYSQPVTNGSLEAWREVPGLSNNLINDLDQDIDGMLVKFVNDAGFRKIPRGHNEPGKWNVKFHSLVHQNQILQCKGGETWLCVKRFQVFEVPVGSLFLTLAACNANEFRARMWEITVVLSSLLIRPQWRTVFSLGHHTRTGALATWSTHKRRRPGVWGDFRIIVYEPGEGIKKGMVVDPDQVFKYWKLHHIEEGVILFCSIRGTKGMCSGKTYFDST